MPITFIPLNISPTSRSSHYRSVGRQANQLSSTQEAGREWEQRKSHVFLLSARTIPWENGVLIKYRVAEKSTPV